MAEPAPSPSALPVVTGAGATFCVVLTFLALQVRAGEDPAIGAGEQAKAPAPPRQVVVKRIIERRVVGTGGATSPAPGGGSRPAAAGGSGGTGGSGTAGAAAPSTPVASPSPAPAAPSAAPAPAPVVSRAS